MSGGRLDRSGGRRTELVCVGTELLTGRVSTHGAFFAPLLEDLGLPLARETTVSDDPAEMASVFREVWRRADIVLATGGLGPTFDDLTREVWSRVLGRRLVFHPEIADEIRARFRRRGLRAPAANRRQAFVLRGAEVLPNPRGTAPGQFLRAGRKILALFPGPARELCPMVRDHLLPRLRPTAPGGRETRVWRFFGVPESRVDEKLPKVFAAARRGPRAVWGLLAQGGAVDVKLTLAGGDVVARADRFIAAEKKLRRLFGPALFGTGEDTLETVVGRALRARRATLAVAESCTGGRVGAKLTAVPGASDYFWGGWIVYDNRAKAALGVPTSVLRRHGAVSIPVARALARAARRRAGTDYALAITGVAGPGGGTDRSPVGRVFLAVEGPRGGRVLQCDFEGEREAVRERAALAGLNALRETLAEGR